MAGRPSLTRKNSASPSTMSDHHPHSSRTGAPDHHKPSNYQSDGPRPCEFLPPRAYALVREQKELLEKTLSDPNLSRPHLASVLRKIQAGTSALITTEEAMLSEVMHHSSAGNANSHNNGAVYKTNDASAPALTAPTSSLSPAALHILQHLETSGFDGTPAEESDAIHSLIDQLPLSQLHD